MAAAQVEGMGAEDEWIYWAGEKSLNLDSEGGVYPSMKRTRESPSRVFTRLHYCYYSPGGGRDLAGDGGESFVNKGGFSCDKTVHYIEKWRTCNCVY